MTYEIFLKNTLRSGEYVTDTIRSTQKFQILLTNRRILVIKEIMTRGFLSSKIKSVEMLDDIPLESIVTVETTQSLFVNIKADISIRTLEREVVLKGLVNPNATLFSNDPMFAPILKEKVLRQVRERRQELERRKPSITIDFSFLKKYTEKGGIVLTTLKCPHCSAPVKMPKNGTETICEHCESTVYAQDIFEKVKKLLE